MMKKLLLMALMTAALLSGERLEANPLAAEARKKIIEFGWDNPTPEYLDRNLEMIESYVPHDGIGIDIRKIITLPNGKKTVYDEWRIFSKIPFRREWYKTDIEHLKNAHARAGHLKYNFINTSSVCSTDEFNLYDDEFWDIVCQKFADLAWVAKQGGCTGLRFDMEDYGNLKPWKYRPARDRGWDEAWEKARARGRQWMTAIAREYPDVTIFFFMSLELIGGDGFADGAADLYERLSSNWVGLLPAFINGIYDALPPKAKIVDGTEGGYGAYDLEKMYRLRGMWSESFPKFLTAENREKFHKQAQWGLPMYMRYYYTSANVHFVKKMEEEKMSMTSFFRRNLARAVQVSDEYVWTWSGGNRKWFPVKFPYAWMDKSLGQNPAVPGPYMGMAIPGVEDAFDYARNPKQYALNRLKKESFPNLAQNPGFDQAGAAKDAPSVPDSKAVSGISPWISWMAPKSRGIISLAKGEGISGDAVRFKGVTMGCILQSIKIRPDGMYVIRACAKTTGKCGAYLVVQWKNRDGKWFAHLDRVSTPFNKDLGNGWKQAVLVIRNIPEGACWLSPVLQSFAGGPNDEVLFDNVEVFNIYEKEPSVAPHLKDALEKWRKDYAAKQKAEVLKNEKKSPPVPGNRVVNGGFQKRGEAVTGHILPEGALFKPVWEAYGQKSRFFAVAGKDAGYADDSAAAIVGGDGCFVFHVTGTKPGQKYRVRAKAKVAGTGKPVLKIFWSSPRSKGPFDLKMGIPTFAFTRKAGNSWMAAEGEIIVPEGATKFALIPTASGLKTGKDHILFDDLEAVLIP